MNERDIVPILWGVGWFIWTVIAHFVCEPEERVPYGFILGGAWPFWLFFAAIGGIYWATVKYIEFVLACFRKGERCFEEPFSEKGG